MDSQFTAKIMRVVGYIILGLVILVLVLGAMVFL